MSTAPSFLIPTPLAQSGTTNWTCSARGCWMSPMRWPIKPISRRCSTRLSVGIGGFSTGCLADELVLGPFQGLVRTRLRRGKGVCAAAMGAQCSGPCGRCGGFGHVACSALSRSEIVLPVRDANGEVRAVLDIGTELDDFSQCGG